jgi:hypothetical protein
LTVPVEQGRRRLRVLDGGATSTAAGARLPDVLSSLDHDRRR